MRLKGRLYLKVHIFILITQPLICLCKCVCFYYKTFFQGETEHGKVGSLSLISEFENGRFVYISSSLLQKVGEVGHCLGSLLLVVNICLAIYILRHWSHWLTVIEAVVPCTCKVRGGESWHSSRMRRSRSSTLNILGTHMYI